MFSYFTSTDEELLEHVRVSSAAKISVAKKYHESKGNLEIVSRINKARLQMKQAKFEAMLAGIKTSLSEGEE